MKYQDKSLSVFKLHQIRDSEGANITTLPGEIS